MVLPEADIGMLKNNKNSQNYFMLTKYPSQFPKNIFQDFEMSSSNTNHPVNIASRSNLK